MTDKTTQKSLLDIETQIEVKTATQTLAACLGFVMIEHTAVRMDQIVCLEQHDVETKGRETLVVTTNQTSHAFPGYDIRRFFETVMQNSMLAEEFNREMADQMAANVVPPTPVQ